MSSPQQQALALGLEPTKCAILSPCGQYRYLLERTWDISKRPAVFVMLNPSTADETQDDPTTRRCISFARAWGCGGIVLVNLFAFRATQPHVMQAAADPVGPLNARYLAKVFGEAQVIVAAWGDYPLARTQAPAAVQVATEAGARLLCLGTCASGAPRHPLYVKGSTAPVSWQAPA